MSMMSCHLCNPRWGTWEFPHFESVCARLWCVCVCVCVFVCVFVCVCAHVSVYACMRAWPACLPTCLSAFMHVCVYISIYIYIHVCALFFKLCYSKWKVKALAAKSFNPHPLFYFCFMRCALFHKTLSLCLALPCALSPLPSAPPTAAVCASLGPSAGKNAQSVGGGNVRVFCCSGGCWANSHQPSTDPGNWTSASQGLPVGRTGFTNCKTCRRNRRIPSHCGQSSYLKGLPIE